MLLRTERLTKTYGSVHALEGLDFEVRPGEIVGLLGPNGSGKTTVLRLLLGFLRPTTGRATIADHDCWHASHLARRHVAYLPGELRLYENMTGRQLVEFLVRLRPDTVHHDPAELARRFDIDLDRPLAQLSSGMKRKVALLAILMPQTPLVILDEPTNTLDPTMRDELLSQLQEARRRGQTVLFSSHVLAEVEAVCDRVAILRSGRLVHGQRLDELRAVQRVRVTFERAVEIPTLGGLGNLEADGRKFAFDWQGPLNDLLRWLGGQAVETLHIEPVGLASVYHRFHAAQ
jgi:ABC-2 type transport system ATP-binding protein